MDMLYCRYADKFMADYQQHMSSKVGLKQYNKDLLSKLLNNMAFDKVDYTNFFRSLGNLKVVPGGSDDELLAPLKNALLDLSKERKTVWLDWVHEYFELVCYLVSICPYRNAANFVTFDTWGRFGRKGNECLW
jgi:uncharacterized protein YdiU (UPF0061 family)